MKISLNDSGRSGVGKFTWELPKKIGKELSDLDQRAAELNIPIGVLEKKQGEIIAELETALHGTLYFMIGALHSGAKMNEILHMYSVKMQEVAMEARKMLRS